VIKIKLMGGLGNQLFQWACVRNLQKLYGHKIIYEDIIAVTKRNADIYRFPKIKLEKFEYIKSVINCEKQMVLYDQFDYNGFFKKIDFSDLDILYYLDGYWQGEKYFTDCVDEIREELQPINKPEIPESSLSIHVRRTDYVGLQNYHPLQPVSYYESAIDLLNHTGNIYVFSDDIQWCKENFKFDNMHFIHNEDPLIDLWTMSSCEKNIIANSTFSWWAAWLNNSPNKKVICPKNWFGVSAPYSDRDILDNDWIKL
jgi:hypothetical protein